MYFNTLILHKIALYVKDCKVIKLFFFIKEYHSLLFSSNSHYDSIFIQYSSNNVRNFYSIQTTKAMYRLYPRLYESWIPMNWAAEYGNLEVVKWIHQSRLADNHTISDDGNGISSSYKLCTTDAMDFAAKNGHLKVIQWLNENLKDKLMYLCTPKALDWAAQNGHFEVVKYLFQNRIEGRSKLAMNYATERGHLKIVQWLYQNNSPYEINIIDGAAYNGHLEVIKWLASNLPSNPYHLVYHAQICSSMAVNYAAKNGHFEVVKWLYENRSERGTILAPIWAAENGYLEIIKFLHRYHKDDLFLSTDIIDRAARSGRLEIIEYLYHNRSNFFKHSGSSPICTNDAMNSAASNGHLDIVKWLYDNLNEKFTQISYKICTTHAMDWAARNGHLEIMKWLYSKRSNNSIIGTCTNSAMIFAIQKKHIDVVKWLHTTFGSNYTSNALNSANHLSDYVNYFNFVNSHCDLTN